MPHAIVTEYEIKNDLLPPLCIRCGQPATVRFQRTIRFIDEPGRWSGLYFVAFMISLFFFPPLLRPILRRARSVELKVPYCGPHLVRFVRRERRALFIAVPFWIVFVVAIDAAVIVALVHHFWTTIAMAAVLFAWMMLIDGVIGRLRRRKKKNLTVRIPWVHPAFVAALLEDRARDRVGNPDRREGFGDVRDDYDDAR
jgi:hypothetical protein